MAPEAGCNCHPTAQLASDLWPFPRQRPPAARGWSGGRRGAACHSCLGSGCGRGCRRPPRPCVAGGGRRAGGGSRRGRAVRPSVAPPGTPRAPGSPGRRGAAEAPLRLQGRGARGSSLPTRCCGGQERHSTWAPATGSLPDECERCPWPPSIRAAAVERAESRLARPVVLVARFRFTVGSLSLVTPYSGLLHSRRAEFAAWSVHGVTDVSQSSWCSL